MSQPMPEPNPPSINTVWTPELLREFENHIAKSFNSGLIRAPVHLSGGNEEQLIDIFKGINTDDWVATTWRSHYHCLLKGVPPAKLMDDIFAGKSITLNYPEHRIFSSAIVGGTLPIALGVAWSIKSRGLRNHVWVFIGDMASCTGVFNETSYYAKSHDLPITFVIEDNGISVCTPIHAVYGDGFKLNTHYYWYDLSSHWPHAGAGKRVQF